MINVIYVSSVQMSQQLHMPKHLPLLHMPKHLPLEDWKTSFSEDTSSHTYQLSFYSQKQCLYVYQKH